MRKSFFLSPSTLFFFVFAFAYLTINAQNEVPPHYYDQALGKSGVELQSALHQVIQNGHRRCSWSNLTYYYKFTDLNPQNTSQILDIYGNCSFAFNQTGCTSNVICDCYEKEHIFCQSWYGYDDQVPIKTDLHHVIPADRVIQGQKRNDNAFCTVGNANDVFENGSQYGEADFFCFDDDMSSVSMAYEPADEYKGDIARSLFYIATRYYGDDASWPTNKPMSIGAQLRPWAIKMLLQWHHSDPVSEREINRNNVIYNGIPDSAYSYPTSNGVVFDTLRSQGNRNPFIDFPELADLIWSNDSSTQTFQYDAIPMHRPAVVQYSYDNQNTLTVAFNRNLDELTVIPVNFHLDYDEVVEARLTDAQTVVLQLASALSEETHYLTVRNCRSEQGVFMNDTVIELFASEGDGRLLAAWSFDGETFPANKVFPATCGDASADAMLYFNGDYASVPPLGLTFSTTQNESVHDPCPVGAPAQSLQVKLQSGSSASNISHAAFVVKISQTHYTNWQIAYDLRGTSTAAKRDSIQWSVDGENYTTVAVSRVSEFGRFVHYSFNFPNVSELQNAENIFLRVAIDSANSANGTACFDNICIYASESTDIGDFHFTQLPSVKIYPNPARTAFFAEAENMQQIELYSPLGQLVGKISNIHSSSQKMDVSHLTPGIYLLRIVFADGRKVTRKIQKL